LSARCSHREPAAAGREHVAPSTALVSFGKSEREAIDEAERFGDADTADAFTEISRETDK